MISASALIACAPPAFGQVSSRGYQADPSKPYGAILDDLERLGYIGRRPDPDDRRASPIVPTPTPSPNTIS